MQRHFNKIALIGHGRIGQAIKTYLEEQQYEVVAFDVNPQRGVIQLDPDNQTPEYFEQILAAYDGVITATPYHLNVPIATAAINSGKAYFDLTEDVDVALKIREMARVEIDKPDERHVWVMPQCGLAPGAVNMVAREIASTFDDVVEINVRVGALPITTNNKMKYYLTWSSDGLVNEYCNPCDALVDGKRVKLQPLEGYEQLVVDGVEYEAFNTSGGIGALIDTLALDVLNRSQTGLKNVNYKTLRYKGHRDLMHFLLDDLGLAQRKEVLVDIFNREIPHTTEDVVVIFIQATGYKDGVFRAETYCRKIYGDDQFTAIQRTTAMGVCTAVHYWATRDWGTELKQWCIDEVYIKAPEHIKLADLVDNPFWDIYR